MVLREEPKDYNIKNVFVSIGVNDNYRYQEIGFIKNLKKTFPNAKIYMIPGSYGWGNAKKLDMNYYSKFGVNILSNNIGRGDPHRNKESYRKIGKEIDLKINDL